MRRTQRPALSSDLRRRRPVDRCLPYLAPPMISAIACAWLRLCMLVSEVMRRSHRLRIQTIVGRTALLVAPIAGVGCGFDASREGAPVDSQTDTPPSDIPIDVPIDASTRECPVDFVATAGGRYRHVTTAASWDDARTSCRNQTNELTPSIHLVVFSNDEERAAVRTAFPGFKTWIGLSDRVMTNVWRWVTAENTGAYPPATGLPWKGGQPNDGGGGDEDCVVMESGGELDDRPCTDTEEFLCECDAFPEVASQSDPQT
jgi:hypothetical protein